MKCFRVIFCIWLVFGCVWVVLGKGRAKQAEIITRTVAHLEVKLRKSNSYTSETVSSSFQYLDELEVLQALDGWLLVRPLGGNIEGWVLESRLTKKKILLDKPNRSNKKRFKKGEGDLAAPGFKPKVEQRFRQSTPELKESFAWLDQLKDRDSELLPSIDDLVGFRREGQLRPLDGGES